MLLPCHPAFFGLFRDVRGLRIPTRFGSRSSFIELLDLNHHPLLRPGAMPKKISKAALNAVVGMMGEDFKMRASGAAGSDKEDELDDDEL